MAWRPGREFAFRVLISLSQQLRISVKLARRATPRRCDRVNGNSFGSSPIQAALNAAAFSSGSRFATLMIFNNAQYFGAAPSSLLLRTMHGTDSSLASSLRASGARRNDAESAFLLGIGPNHQGINQPTVLIDEGPLRSSSFRVSRLERSERARRAEDRGFAQLASARESSLRFIMRYLS